LAGDIVERPGRGRGGRSLLWLARLRHRRLDPLAIRRQWSHRAEADLGPRQPARRIPAGGNARPCGPDGRSAVDAGAILGVIAGSDANDPTAGLDPVPDYLAVGGQGVRGLRIGVDPAWNGDDVDATTQAVLSEAIEVFRTLGVGHRRCPVSRRDAGHRRLGSQLRSGGGSCARATYPSRKDEYGPVLASVIEAGRALSGLDYQKILLRRLDLRGRVAALFNAIDLLLIPVHPFAPPTLAMIRTLGEQPELITQIAAIYLPV